MSKPISNVNLYPMITPVNIDFGAEHKFRGSHIKSNSGEKEEFVIVEINLTGRNLVRSLVEEDQAVIANLVTAPWCAYSDLKTIERDQLSITAEQITGRQLIPTETEEYSTPFVFQPFVIQKKALDVKLSEEHGVNELWIGSQVHISKGSKLALDFLLRSEDPLESILKIKEDADGSLPDGCFEVSEVEESGYFYFEVRVSKDLYKSLTSVGNSVNHQRSIYCFALAQGLEILQREYREPEAFQQFANLRGLHAYLRENKAQTWDMEGFCANRAVAKCVPHVLDAIVE